MTQCKNDDKSDGNSNGERSRLVHNVMDHLGYSQEMVHQRRIVYWERDIKLNEVDTDFFRITAGSKGEGFSSRTESDVDVLNIHRYAQCSLDNSQTYDETDTTFTMDAQTCHPGHFLLKLLKKGSRVHHNIENSLEESVDGDVYISSFIYTQHASKSSHAKMNPNFQAADITGPAVPQTRGQYRVEIVFALPCACSGNMLSEWIERSRPHSWPQPWLVEKVAKQEAQLVPVGCMGSQNRGREWRVCFIPGELLLTKSLTETQYKLYIIMKKVNKHELKPICDDLSSYMMKNIIYWTVESNPSDIFTPENLLNTLTLCLNKLQQCVKDNYLPYYMIPGRNLLIGKLSSEIRLQVTDKLEELIQEGPAVILRLHRFKDALEMSHNELAKRSYNRNELERYDLVRMNITAMHWRPGRSYEERLDLITNDPQHAGINHTINDMVWPEWRQYAGQDRQTILQAKIDEALS
ncbi:hypothetical protein MAR_027607 [Mya arenaria]|uniref:Mab-21-like HhH/H2TH-like domain-containing protein n=1 Tax=Mya arenaria TaxID=6604 RepID=A0ABY7EW07_MYAAR|nr:uncharacterized protein LOC128243216 [Mya arenaria]WAR13427.1 hypothetical protein MAR_027607 [Mya arenaria]